LVTERGEDTAEKGLRSLSRERRAAVEALRAGYVEALGGSLHALYLYGAIAFPESEAIVDMDFHGFLHERPDSGRQAALAVVAETLARDHGPWGADLEGWLVLLEESRGSAGPEHVLFPGLRDESWALHRAHWLAGRCFVLHGPPPAEIVLAPTWDELAADLVGELDFAKRSKNDAFAVLNACRILHSFTARDVVHSKFGSAGWGLAHLPENLQPVIRAAMATYRAKATPDDGQVLASMRDPLLSYVEGALPRHDC
jgi:Domain of unknown function (DUF4111)